jgi:glycosyltransferase involved in cell wall biosynthesis
MDARPDPVAPAVIQRVRAAKAARRALGFAYEEQPRLAFVVHSFNRIANVDQLVDGLRATGPHELIVCDDGSVDGSRSRWSEHLDRPNDFLILSNDLHEIRITDRAIRWTRADIVCLVQDDDDIPDDASWIHTALEHFAAEPTLAILGGFMGFHSFDPDPAVAVPLWGPDEFRYVHHVNIGPYFIRRSSYEDLGGWDHTFSAPGDPGICFDSELCLRAWTKGYRVGYSFTPLKGPAGHYAMDGGTNLFTPDERERNRLANSRRIHERYASRAEEIDVLVKRANASLRGAARGM